MTTAILSATRTEEIRLAAEVAAKEKRVAELGSDPITVRAGMVLGWLIAKGGSADAQECAYALAPQTTHDDGVVGVHYAIGQVDGGVLYRRGYIERRDDTVSVTLLGYAYFRSPLAV